MCGIAGIFSSGNTNLNYKYLKDMVNKLEHRGPDDYGLWRDNNVNIFLGHRRLAIQDLSEFGAQPMKSFDERFVIVFNGEIYNHFELRKKLLQKVMKFLGRIFRFRNFNQFNCNLWIKKDSSNIERDVCFCIMG